VTKEYDFTQDWFHWAIPVWTQIKPIVKERKSFLEIGSFEGRSAVWTIENMMDDNSELTCIDTWEGSEEHVNGELTDAENKFDANIKIATDKHLNRVVHKLKGDSYTALAKLITPVKAEYDFIYIDGSHIARDVLTDACMAFPLLKTGGVMVFDDYLWGEARDALHRPKIAIDSFTTIHAEKIQWLHLGSQLVIRKI